MPFGYSYQNSYTNRILSNANTFKNQSHPGGDGYWVGYTGSGCVPGGQQVRPANRALGRSLLQSAFVFLLTGDTPYADTVKTELLNQITVPGTNFADMSMWCPFDGTANHVYAIDASEIWPWQQRYVYTYDYLIAGGYTGFTAQNKTDILD
jgi:hypothetical protein